MTQDIPIQPPGRTLTFDPYSGSLTNIGTKTVLVDAVPLVPGGQRTINPGTKFLVVSATEAANVRLIINVPSETPAGQVLTRADGDELYGQIGDPRPFMAAAGLYPYRGVPRRWRYDTPHARFQDVQVPYPVRRSPASKPGGITREVGVGFRPIVIEHPGRYEGFEFMMGSSTLVSAVFGAIKIKSTLYSARTPETDLVSGNSISNTGGLLYAPYKPLDGSYDARAMTMDEMLSAAEGWTGGTMNTKTDRIFHYSFDNPPIFGPGDVGTRLWHAIMWEFLYEVDDSLWTGVAGTPSATNRFAIQCQSGNWPRQGNNNSTSSSRGVTGPVVGPIVYIGNEAGWTAGVGTSIANTFPVGVNNPGFTMNGASGDCDQDNQTVASSTFYNVGNSFSGSSSGATNNRMLPVDGATSDILHVAANYLIEDI